MTISPMARNITLYPWVVFAQGLVFWQAIWFLFFQDTLSASEAILLYVIYDISVTALEVPSGYMSDRLGRRITLLSSGVCALLGTALLAMGSTFAAFAVAQGLIGAATAFSSGTGSSLMFESLRAEGREDEVEAQELRAWRFGFVASAVSAATGGMMAQVVQTLPFLAGIVTAGVMLVLASRLCEPPRGAASHPPVAQQMRSLGTALRKPVLIWLFALSTIMYAFSHVIYVFGQPYIFEALATRGLEGDAPLISGFVSGSMMLISVLTSVIAWRLRQRFGLAATLLLAYGIQVGLITVLALTNSIIAIAFLFLRMVPSSLSTPFVLARIQPELSSDMRATYLSVQSFVGRIALAGTLYVASFGSTDVGQMPYAEIRAILVWYVAAGLVAFVCLALASRRVRLEREP
ncbi:MAG: MFS transporter [Roseovarius sp.]